MASADMATAELQSLLYQEAHPDDTKVNRIIGSSVVCLVIAYASVLFRFVARRLSRASLQADDWWMFASLVSRKANHLSQPTCNVEHLLVIHDNLFRTFTFHGVSRIWTSCGAFQKHQAVYDGMFAELSC